MMKRLFLFVLISTLLLSTASFAKAKFGVKAGLDFATASVSPMQPGISKKGIVGLIIGGTVSAPLPSLDQNISLRGDIAYVQKGVKLTWRTGEDKFTFDELDFSPFLVYNIPGLSGAVPYIMAGPELGFVMSTSEDYKDDYYGSSSGDIKEAASTDFSLNIGGGVALPLKNRAEVVFDLRYCIGLSDMNDNNEAKGKLRGLQLTVGYNFPTPR
jgi:hypothetical protein